MSKEADIRKLVKAAQLDIQADNLQKAWKKLRQAIEMAKKIKSKESLNYIFETIQKFTYSTETYSVELSPIETEGLILDIGGGGEGIIGKLNGGQVVSIDISKKELQETRNEALKVVMDATELKFKPKSFEVCTAFFTFMYIPNDKHLKVFQEAHRVLKTNGKLLIWDVKIPEERGDYKLFKVRLRIQLPSEEIKTDYGVQWKRQNIKHFKEMAQKTGFRIIKEWSEDEIFHLEMSKKFNLDEET